MIRDTRPHPKSEVNPKRHERGWCIGTVVSWRAGEDEVQPWWIEAPRFILHSATGRTPT